MLKYAILFFFALRHHRADLLGRGDQRANLTPSFKPGLPNGSLTISLKL
jgi:hypothetical protein